MNRKSPFFFLLLLSVTACTNLFYYPDNVFRRELKDWPGEAEEITLEDKDEPNLYGWRIFARNQSAKANVLFFHGNAQNISTHVTLVDWLSEYGFDVTLFDYRGYGRSQGGAEIEGIHRDVTRMLAWAKQESKKRNQKLILYGQSLGASMLPWVLKTETLKTGVLKTGDLAQEDAPDLCAIILESPFYSYQSIALEKLGQIGLLAYLASPALLFIRNDYSPKHFVPGLSEEILFVIADQDAVISPKQTEKLAALSQKKKLWRVGGAGHVQAFRDATWRKSLVGYMKKRCFTPDTPAP